MAISGSDCLSSRYRPAAAVATVVANPIYGGIDELCHLFTLTAIDPHKEGSIRRPRPPTGIDQSPPKSKAVIEMSKKIAGTVGLLAA
jgi:hypothetical protein